MGKTGPSFEKHTIEYSSSFLAYGTVGNPGPRCDEYFVDDGFHVITFSDLYFNPITTSVFQKPGCPPVTNPRLSLPAELTSVDPAWGGCEPLFYGAFDPPSFLKKTSGRLASPIALEVLVTSAEPAVIEPISAVAQAIPSPVTPIATEDPNRITAVTSPSLAELGAEMVPSAQNTSPPGALSPTSLPIADSSALVSAATTVPKNWGQSERPTLPFSAITSYSNRLARISEPLEGSQSSGPSGDKSNEPKGRISSAQPANVPCPSASSFDKENKPKPIFVKSAELTNDYDTEISVPSEPIVYVESHMKKSVPTNTKSMVPMTSMPIGIDLGCENISVELPDSSESGKSSITRWHRCNYFCYTDFHANEVAPGDCLRIAGHTIVQSARVTAVGVAVSVSIDNVVLANTTCGVSPESSHVPNPPIVSGDTSQMALRNKQRVADQLLESGTQAQASGDALSGGASNLMLSLPTPVPLLIGGQTASRQPNGNLFVAGRTVTLGSQVTISGLAISFGPSNLLLDGTNFTLPPAAMSHTLARSQNTNISTNQIVQSTSAPNATLSTTVRSLPYSIAAFSSSIQTLGGQSNPSTATLGRAMRSSHAADAKSIGSRSIVILCRILAYIASIFIAGILL